MMIGWRKAIHLEARVAQLDAENRVLERSLASTREAARANLDVARIELAEERQDFELKIRQLEADLAASREAHDNTIKILRDETDRVAVRDEAMKARDQIIEDQRAMIASLQSAAEHARTMILRQRKRIRRLRRWQMTPEQRREVEDFPAGRPAERVIGRAIPVHAVGDPEPEDPAANVPRDASIEPESPATARRHEQTARFLLGVMEREMVAQGIMAPALEQSTCPGDIREIMG